jgi:selenide,water dikinase
MCRASGCSAVIDLEKLPKIPEAISLAASFVLPDNATRNWNAYENDVQINNAAAFPWLCDPQTNGGLLVAAAPEVVEDLCSKYSEFTVVGRFTENSELPLLAVN